MLEKIAVYRSCEDVSGNLNRKKFMNIKVSELISSNFNAKVANSVGLFGRQRIFVTFKVDKTGNVKSIKAKGSHPYLETEAVRIIEMIPQMQLAYQRRKPVVMPFSIPIVYQIN